MERVKFAVYGLGPIGSLIAKHALDRGWMELVAAIDIDPGKIGRDAGDVVGLGEKTGVIVEKDAGECLRRTRPDIVFHATGSYLDRVYTQVLDAVNVGADVISTCETLSYPYYRYPEISAKLDGEARKHGSTVLGTGINPGFLLDLLPAVMTAPCIRVERIVARRVLEASKRRESFRRKIGLGLDRDIFEERLRAGELTAHVGYAESVYLIADAMRLRLDSVDEGQEAIIAEKRVEIGDVKVEANKVRGVRGYGVGFHGGREVIRIEFVAAVGVEKEYEEIMIEGDPRIVWRNESGTPGDIATAAVTINYVPAVLASDPGLKIVTRLRPPSYCFTYDPSAR